VRPIKTQFDLMEAARKYQEAKYILGKFPTDRMHEGGPVRNPYHDVDPTAGEFIEPRAGPASTQPPSPWQIDWAGYHPSPRQARVQAQCIRHGPGQPTIIETECPCGRHLEVELPAPLVCPPRGSLRRAP